MTAGSRSGIEAGRAFVKMFVDDSQMRAQLQGVQAKLRATAAAIDGVGRKLQSFGVRAVLPFAAALAVFAPFSDQMKTVQAVTQATGEEFDRLTEKAKHLGATTSFSASQVAGAMVELGRAGFNTSQIEAATEHVLNLARATNTELPRAAEVLASTMNQFGLQAEDSQRIADVLAATTNSSAQGMEDLAEALKPVAPIAADAGATLEETSAAIGLLANNGIRGSLAGNALARAYKNLASSDIRGKIERLGVAVVDNTGNLRAMTDIVADIATATAEMGNADRLATFEEVFGRGSSAALKLAGSVKSTSERMEELSSPQARARLEQLGVSLTDTAGNARSLGEIFEEVKTKVDGLSNEERTVVFRELGFNDLLSKISLWQNAAAETAAQMDSGLGGAWRRMLSAIEAVAIALGEAIEGDAAEWAQWISDTAAASAKWIAQNRALVVLVAKIAAGSLALGTALVAAAAAIRVITFMVTAYRAAITAAAFAQSMLVALSSPQGWALVAAGVAVATAAVVALNEALEDTVEKADAAQKDSDAAADKMAALKDELDAAAAAGPPDVAPQGVPQLQRARNAAEQLAVAMASARGETERALRAIAGADALKRIELLGGDASTDPATRVRQMIEQMITPAEKLKRKLLEVDAAFALLERPLPDGVQNQVRLSVIDQSTGILSTIRDLQDEIAVLTGRATESQQAFRKMLDGVPEQFHPLVAQVQQLTELRDRLAEQQRQHEAEQRERDRREQQRVAELRSRAEQLRDQNTTAEERIQFELSELEELRKAIDPETNTPLLDEETYRRELERLHQRQIELAAQDARRINGDTGRVSSSDLRTQAGADAIAQLINGRTDLDQQQLRELQLFNRYARELVELTEEKQLVKKVVF